jgi:hypothetical protein
VQLASWQACTEKGSPTKRSGFFIFHKSYPSLGTIPLLLVCWTPNVPIYTLCTPRKMSSRVCSPINPHIPLDLYSWSRSRLSFPGPCLF